MSHTVDAPAGAGAEWVRCRARVWQVLGVRHDAGTAQWQLASGNDLPRLIATPPDDVTHVRAAVRSSSRAGWARRVRSLLAAHPPFWWPRHSSALAIDRLPFQFVPSMLMLSGHHRRLLIADQVGTGKTLEAALLLREVHAREPTASTLVVTPAALIAQWHRELHRHAGLDATVIHADLLRAEALRPPRDVRASRAGGCFLASIDLLRQPEITPLFTSVAWTLLVVDEAHHAAPGTARLEAVSRLAASSVRVLLLTATPTAAGPAGADALRALGRRSGERAMAVLCRQPRADERKPRRTHLLRVRTSRTDAALHCRLDRFVVRARAERGVVGLLPALVLRRRAASCPAALIRSLDRRLAVLDLDLPPQLPLLPFDDEASAEVDAADDELMRVRAWRDAGEEREELEYLLALARDCPPAGRKGSVIDRLVTRSREPAVVFTAYVDTLRQLRTALHRHEMTVIHGHTPEALRAAAIDAFTGGQCAVLLTTDASAEGLNLHDRCRLVIHADVPSTPRLFQQRTGRVDRYGQKRRVHVVVMATRSTHDAEALQRLQMRQTEDEHWRATVSVDRCRRTRLAARRLSIEASSDVRDVGANARVQGPAGAARAAPDVVVHRIAPRGWRRVARSLLLPLPAARLIVGVLRAGGEALLTQTDHVVAAASTSAQSREAAHGWLSSCCPRASAQRARRLVRRLAAWENDAARALDASAMHEHRDGLFGDAEASDHRRAPVSPPSPTPVMAISVAAVLERRP